MVILLIKKFGSEFGILKLGNQNSDKDFLSIK